MRKIYLPLPIICLFVSFLLLPVVKAGNNDGTIYRPVKHPTRTGNFTAEQLSNLIYDSLQLNSMGLPREALVYAVKGQQTLQQKGLLQHPDILTVCDFSQPSDSKRMYIIDIKNYKVLLNTYVAHGKNSGLEYARKFSNRLKSQQSSLGFYITGNTYSGKHGLSLRLTGLDKGFNDNAARRAVVVHGARYIGESRADAVYMGRSFGCPAVPQSVAPKVINLIKQGSCLFIYSPLKSYLHGSSILNG